MALLSPHARARRGWVMAAAALSLAGCYLVEKLQSHEPKLVFSHRVHVVEQGLDCTDCHGGAEDSDEPGMPVAAQCALCHQDLDAEKPPPLQVATLFVDGHFAAKHLSHLPGEVRFSHAKHVTAKLECAACHGAIEASDEIQPEVGVSMQECSTCHVKQGLGEDCASCHSEIRVDRAPRTHVAAWLKVHGEEARARTGAKVDDCAMCHTQNSCTQCHQTEMPQSHTNFWRRRGHAQVAAFDRDQCSTCHESDSCNRCHEQALPVTHHGSWGGTRSNHCFECHFPLRAESCATCHKNTDSHQAAPPRPANHFPGMDCRQCHGLSAPLPHADNGADCTICHS